MYPKLDNLMYKTKNNIKKARSQATFSISAKTRQQLLSVTAATHSLYWYLCDRYIEYDGYLFESESTMARAIGVSRQTVITAIKELVRLNLIGKVYRHRHTLLIRVYSAHQYLRRAKEVSTQAFKEALKASLHHYNNIRKNTKLLNYVTQLFSPFGMENIDISEANARACNYFPFTC